MLFLKRKKAQGTRYDDVHCGSSQLGVSVARRLANAE